MSCGVCEDRVDEAAATSGVMCPELCHRHAGDLEGAIQTHTEAWRRNPAAMFRLWLTSAALWSRLRRSS